MLQPLANYVSFARIILFHLVYVHRSQNIYGLSPLNTISKWRFALNMRIFCSYNGQYNSHLYIQFVLKFQIIKYIGMEDCRLKIK